MATTYGKVTNSNADYLHTIQFTNNNSSNNNSSNFSLKLFYRSTVLVFLFMMHGSAGNISFVSTPLACRSFICSCLVPFLRPRLSSHFVRPFVLPPSLRIPHSVRSPSYFVRSFVRSFVRFLHRISFVPSPQPSHFFCSFGTPCIPLHTHTHTHTHLLATSLVFAGHSKSSLRINLCRR